MRSASSRRQSSPWKPVVIILAALLLGGTTTIGGLWAAGVDLPFLKREPDYRGMVAIPITARAIPAYTKVTRDYLLIPETGTPKYIYLPPDTAKSLDVIMDFSKITGRVMDHEKPPGYPFKEEDFLPKGTRPGLVAGIPAGKRAVTVDVTKIQGISALQVGDRIDIVSSLPVDMQKVLQNRGSGNGSFGGSGVQIGILAQMKQANVRVLVQNGALVSPVTTRVIPISSSSLTQGAVTRTKPIQEAVIAVDPEEIAPLTEAIAVEANINCVARSGHPDDPGATSITPHGINLADQIAPVESIRGGKREVLLIPKSANAARDMRGLVPVPICSKPIPALSKITFDHLIDSTTGRLHVVYFRPEDVRRLGLITDVTKIVGRVAQREKLSPHAFKEDDFAANTDPGESRRSPTAKPPVNGPPSPERNPIRPVTAERSGAVPNDSPQYLSYQ